MFHYRCDTCDYTRDMGFIGREYVFSDGRRMRMLQRHIWCPQCREITVAEAFAESAEECETRVMIRELHQHDLANAAPGENKTELLKELVAEFDAYDQALADWRALRKRPPFCLKCGCEKITVPREDTEDLPHPVCGGTLRCTLLVFGGTCALPEPHRYSVEGELVALGRYQPRLNSGRSGPLELWWP